MFGTFCVETISNIRLLVMPILSQHMDLIFLEIHLSLSYLKVTRPLHATSGTCWAWGSSKGRKVLATTT